MAGFSIGGGWLSDKVAEIGVAEEDQLRADWYGLLGRLIATPPDQETLDTLRGLEGDRSVIGEAVSALAVAAQQATPESVKSEYFDLFIGVGQGELLPFASYYLTGFLNEKPLARLRRDMALLRIARADDVKEPEDHVAAICEMMSGMITGAFGRVANLSSQRDFFNAHLGSWAPRFFEDLENAPSSYFYAPVGTIGRCFMDIEIRGFEMAA